MVQIVNGIGMSGVSKFVDFVFFLLFYFLLTFLN